jgi:hypothetical protein
MLNIYLLYGVVSSADELDSVNEIIGLIEHCNIVDPMDPLLDGYNAEYVSAIIGYNTGINY